MRACQGISNHFHDESHHAMLIWTNSPRRSGFGRYGLIPAISSTRTSTGGRHKSPDVDETMVCGDAVLSCKALKQATTWKTWR